jgi:hypothetical protein
MEHGTRNGTRNFMLKSSSYSPELFSTIVRIEWSSISHCTLHCIVCDFRGKRPYIPVRNRRKYVLFVVRWAGKALAQKILHTELDHSDFMILVGVSDSSTYGGVGLTSWQAPPTWQVYLILFHGCTAGMCSICVCCIVCSHCCGCETTRLVKPLVL